MKINKETKKLDKRNFNEKISAKDCLELFQKFKEKREELKEKKNENKKEV